MTMKKTIQSQSVKPIKTAQKNDFPVGQKFVMGDELWTVLKEEEADNTPMRKISSRESGDQIVELKYLTRGIDDGEVKLIGQ